MFQSYVEDIDNAIGIFDLNRERCGEYMEGLTYKFRFLLNEANERLAHKASFIFSEEALCYKPEPGSYILFQYFRGIIREIERLASLEAVRLKELRQEYSEWEAIQRTFGEQFSESGEIACLIDEAGKTMRKVYEKYARYRGEEWKKVCYEYRWFAKMLPRACWSELGRVVGK